MAVQLDVGQPTLLPPRTGEIIGDSEDRRVEILCDDDALSATWSRFGPGRDGTDPHVHRHHTDLFYVLAGELTIGLGAGGSETVTPAGTLVLAPPLVVHGFRNASAEEVRYLNFHAPGEGFADYLRSRRDGTEATFDSDDPPADGGRSTEDAIITLGELTGGGTGFSVTLLADIDAIAVAELRGEPGAERPVYVERRLECFYVLEGVVVFSVGERKLSATPGAWVQIPPGVPRSLAVAGSAEARFLEIRT